MQRTIRTLSTALAALLLAASFSAALAGGLKDGYSQQQDPPKDCRKDPNDPRCKK